MPGFVLHRIESLDLDPLQPYRTLRRSQEHLNAGIFVAEAEKVVRRFLDSDWEILSLLMTQEWFDELIPTVEEGRLDGVDVYVGDKALLETIVGFSLHQGIMGVGRVPRAQSLYDAVADLPSAHLLVALDGLAHAENVGTIVRNCAGFGVDAVIAGKTSASPYLRRAVRNSMGGVFKLPVVHVEELAVSLHWLATERNTRILVADAHGDRPIHETGFAGPICLVLGNEDTGVSDAVLAVATERVRIPMHKSTDSLNVASASAVLLYEARRKRPI